MFSLVNTKNTLYQAKNSSKIMNLLKHNTLKICTIICVFLLNGVLIQEGQSAEENRVKDVQMSSRVVEEGYVVALDHPKILLGTGYDSEEDENPEKVSFFFDGLHVMIYGKRVYVNSKFCTLAKRPKVLNISDDAEKLIVDGVAANLENIVQDDQAIDFELLDKCKLENGYRFDFIGGFVGVSCGVGIDDDHYMINRSGIIVKIWGEDVYLWGRHIGKLSEIADNNKIIKLELKKILHK
jgi:hypothetical protein